MKRKNFLLALVIMLVGLSVLGYRLLDPHASVEQRRLSTAATNIDNAKLQRLQLRYAKAAAYFKTAADVLPKGGHEQERAEYLNSAGYDFQRIARYADALSLFEESLKISREIARL